MIRLVAIGLLAAGCRHSNPPPRAPPTVENRVEPGEAPCTDAPPACFPQDLVLSTTTGQTYQAGDLAGHVVVLTFWASWAKPAATDIPTFNGAFAMYAAKGVVILGVLVDDLADPELRTFIADHEIGYPIVRIDQALADAFGIPANIPKTLVYDRDGRLQAEEVGTFDRATLAELLERLSGSDVEDGD